MSLKVSVGIDIGTHTIKTIVTQIDTANKDQKKPQIVGYGIAETKGLRHGYIIDVEEASKSIRESVNLAEKTSGYKIAKAYVSISSIGLQSASFSKAIEISKESEINEQDKKRVIAECEEELPESWTINKEIIHSIPLHYKVDGKPVLGKTEGMYGSKLEVKMLFVACLKSHFEDIMDAVLGAGIEILDIMASPLAGSLSCLTKTQQIAGCVLANIGSETTAIAVFENGTPISLEVFPIGGSDVTNDLALGLKISLEDAEKIKLSKPESVPYPRKKIEEIITARLSDIFDLIESHLKKLGRSGLLPAGIIFTGGGACVQYLEELGKQILKLPAKKVCIKYDGGEQKLNIKDGSWATAYGLCILGLGGDNSNSPVNRLGMRFIHKAKSNIWSWIKKMIP